ncbi:MAG: hypothetical protein J0L88_07045 [Xanthomonadales bacterium]|nr:hypothetical protein [Xanthomonadales bacterium]
MFLSALGCHLVNANTSLRVDRSAISRSRADFGLNGPGGGIHVAAGGELAFVNRTVSDNVAEGSDDRLSVLGSMRTFSMIAGANALDCADDRGVRLVADQRGQARPAGVASGGCDIGASEGLGDAIFIDGFDG